MEGQGLSEGTIRPARITQDPPGLPQTAQGHGLPAGISQALPLAESFLIAIDRLAERFGLASGTELLGYRKRPHRRRPPLVLAVGRPQLLDFQIVPTSGKGRGSLHLDAVLPWRGRHGRQLLRTFRTIGTVNLEQAIARG